MLTAGVFAPGKEYPGSGLNGTYLINVKRNASGSMHAPVGSESPIMRQSVSEIGTFRRDIQEKLLSFARRGRCVNLHPNMTHRLH